MHTEWQGEARGCARSASVATGLPITLVTAPAFCRPLRFNARMRPFCSLLLREDGTCSGDDVRTQKRLFALVQRTRSSHFARCKAGVVLFAVPLIINGGVTAAFWGGQVFDCERCERTLPRFMHRMAANGMRSDREVAEAYLAAPHMSRTRIRATIRVLELAASSLAESAAHRVLDQHHGECPAVASAKDYVLNHLTEPIHLADAALHAHLEPHYFCRLFHKVTGLTFGEYVTRCRIERVKRLLANPSARISDIAFECGFGSIPHFNRVFLKSTGLSPSEYRARIYPF